MDWHIINLIGSLVFGVAASALAGSRGRRPGVWFAIGFFFGLIGFLVLVFKRDLSAGMSGEYVASTNATTTCPYCSPQVGAHALICDHCERLLSGAA